ncbi:MAG: hypothetical protein PVF68_12215 [Acidobacteriota bacterium]|jgi:YbbR domain-containing protein
MKGSWTTNIALKIAALVLAAGVWYTYRTDQLGIRFVTVPLQFQNLPADRVLSGDVPGSITVQLEAPEAMARSLTPDRIEAEVDLASVELGLQEVRIDPEEVRIPAGVRLLSITPAIIPLKVERRVRKTLPVEARVRGEAGAGHEVTAIRLLPTEVVVEGPASEIETSTKAFTEWITIRGQVDTFQEGVAVVPDSSKVRLVGARSAIVTVEIRPIPGQEAPGEGEDEAGGEERAGP